MTSSIPALPHATCPLCGGPNACAPATTGSLETPCWCREVRFSLELLARVPESAMGRACICRRCAEEGRMDEKA